MATDDRSGSRRLDQRRVRVLADTHALVWGLEDASSLSKAARRILGEAEVMVSVASLWELLLKRAKHDALVVDPLAWWDKYVVKADLVVLGIRQTHVLQVGRLPEFHRDPFDRILIAQAIVENIPLLSKDRQLSSYGVKVLW